MAFSCSTLYLFLVLDAVLGGWHADDADAGQRGF